MTEDRRLALQLAHAAREHGESDAQIVARAESYLRFLEGGVPPAEDGADILRRAIDLLHANATQKPPTPCP